MHTNICTCNILARIWKEGLSLFCKIGTKLTGLNRPGHLALECTLNPLEVHRGPSRGRT